jgi:hypothetical protein
MFVNQVTIRAMPITKPDGHFSGRCPTFIVFHNPYMGRLTTGTPYFSPVAPQELQAMTIQYLSLLNV